MILLPQGRGNEVGLAPDQLRAGANGGAVAVGQPGHVRGPAGYAWKYGHAASKPRPGNRTQTFGFDKAACYPLHQPRIMRGQAPHQDVKAKRQARSAQPDALNDAWVRLRSIKRARRDRQSTDLSPLGERVSIAIEAGRKELVPCF